MEEPGVAKGGMQCRTLRNTGLESVHLEKIVEFSMSLPGASAAVESILINE